ncbi:MAG: alpha/beta fold hydrolase [Nitrospirae bacterium]|nr:alpha/beta fold hydrolase [Nitrospirota bacterium]
MPAFSAKYSVIIFDNRGVGRTDTTKPPYSAEQMAGDVKGLMDVLGVRNAHILGYSMGGQIAQELAGMYPGYVRSLILAGSYARQTPIGLSKTRLLLQMFMEGVNPEFVVKTFFLWLFSNRFFEDEEQVNIAVKNFLNPHYPQPPDGLEGQGLSIINYDGRERVGKISAPTLIIAGKNDIAIPLSCTEGLASKIPNSELIILENAAHSMIFEEPERFNRIVMEFLGRMRIGDR